MGPKFGKGQLRRSPESMASWPEGQVTEPNKAAGVRPGIGGREDKGRAGSLSLRSSGRGRDTQQKA